MGLGEKKQAVMQYNSQGLRLRLALPIVGISKSQYYYQPLQGKQGKKPSVLTPIKKQDKETLCSNNQVVERIQQIHQDPDLTYGYHAMTKALQQEGYQINHKKVYRLMKENQLLQSRVKITGKTYVKYRKVQPTRPLEVLEMDIKLVWITQARRHAFVLNILDTFNRKWLYQSVAFSITQRQVKQAWEHIIEKHLQPNDMLKNKLHVEIRNDNDKRFSAQMIQDFFKENHLNQVFTHPYTPQENGHVESFHSILTQHLKRFTFWSLEDLEKNLILYQEKYNNKRLHGSIAHLCPNDFDILWTLGHIQMSSLVRQKKIVFKLKIPRHKIRLYTGNYEPEESSSHDFEPLDQAIKSKPIKIDGATISGNSRYKKSPSVAPRKANIKLKITTFENLKC
jgi:putative transposase